MFLSVGFEANKFGIVPAIQAPVAKAIAPVAGIA